MARKKTGETYNYVKKSFQFETGLIYVPFKYNGFMDFEGWWSHTGNTKRSSVPKKKL